MGRTERGQVQLIDVTVNESLHIACYTGVSVFQPGSTNIVILLIAFEVDVLELLRYPYTAHQSGVPSADVDNFHRPPSIDGVVHKIWVLAAMVEGED
jgi:hypothetical protein